MTLSRPLCQIKIVICAFRDKTSRHAAFHEIQGLKAPLRRRDIRRWDQDLDGVQSQSVSFRVSKD